MQDAIPLTSALWILVSAALVLLMVPGLALFYGGMSRSKNVLNMLMMNMVCLGLVPVVWVVVGYTLSSTGTNQWIGGFDNAFLIDVPLVAEDGLSSPLLGVFFALTFASITPALISGAVADRMSFRAWIVFVPVWLLLVFVPAWAWVFRPDVGFLTTRGSLDFAGGTVVHVAAGSASLALVMVLGRRRGWPSEPMPPHSLPLTMLGAGILWFGWFGFNAGSAFDVSAVTVQAFANTFMAAGVAMLAWLLVERIVDGHATSLGAASGIVAGLVGITPGAGFMGTWGAMGVGLFAGALCALAVRLKYRFGYDDALDVVGVHLVGGLVGGILIGFFANSGVFGESNPDADGVFAGGGGGLLLEQIFANVFVMVFAFVVTYVIARVLDALIGLRVAEDDERTGLDQSEHAETAYS
ncbi:MAG: ammonium transporter [Acidimicrobiia bacterium]|nr:ammonium transporter [Acidimicrobiia bacterium]